MALGCARERARGEEEGEGECERGRGGCVASPGRPDEGGGEGRQAEREVAWRGGARARRACARPPVGEEDDRGGAGGLGRRWLLGRPGRTGRRPR